MNTVRMMLVGGTVLAFAASQANSFTVATFADPSNNASEPLFFVSDSAVAASWSGMGLTLEIPVAGTSYSDATFNMPTVTRAGNNLGAGVITFMDAASVVRLVITFDGGTIFEPLGTGSSYLLGHNVSFASPDFSSAGWTDEQFSFSFANPSGFGTPDRTYTASFTSSAVPEPATLAALGFGLAALAARRRTKRA